MQLTEDSILESVVVSTTHSQVITRVALVNMPFAMADRPSIQCGLLKSSLTREGHDVDVHYLNLEFAAEFGARRYRELSLLRTELLLGEWLFSVAAFGYRPNEEEYRATCSSLPTTCERLGLTFEDLCRLRNEVLPAWIERWAEEVAWDSYSVIGFTTTFEQNTAAFALAKAIKERHPWVTVVFGGANFDGTMGREYIRALPFIDYAVTGEGENVLPQIVGRVARGERADGVPGVLHRRDGIVEGNGPAPLIRNLDDLPDPEYDDYFSTLFRLGRERVLAAQPPLLLFETARGCWWGEKQHCTFCGLNNNGMSFRAKSPGEAVGLLHRLASRYKIINFEAVDNIMDYKYLTQLCEPLMAGRFDYRIFYEVKANLTPAQLRTMKQAGITAIQPGIESLNSHILTLMRKGITMIRNVRLLKWSYYYGMKVGWNLLTGFPGETEEDYEEQIRVIRALRHLPPPDGTGRIWLERFSPYFFDTSFPVRNVRPLEVYRLIYPEEQIDLKEIAYFFRYDMDHTLPDERHRELRAEIDKWKEEWQRRPRPALVYQKAPDWIQIVDRRTEQPSAHAFHNHDAVIYEFCGETDRNVDAIVKHLEGTCEAGSVDVQAVRDALEKFCSLGLMLEEKGRFLSLALPANPNW